MYAKDILQKARRFCQARNIQESTLGMYAVGDARALERLERGTMTYRRAARLEKYIEQNAGGVDDMEVGDVV